MPGGRLALPAASARAPNGSAGRVGLGARLRGDGVGVDEALGRRRDDEQGLLGRVKHIDRVDRRHVVADVGGGLGGGAHLVAQRLELGLAEGWRRA